jgi:AcrR family transcriptional regulator
LTVRTIPAGYPADETTTLESYERLKPGPGQSRFDVIASQRARLQRAMIELAGREGLDAVTVRKLTKLAGVSTGSFYARFSGTDDCLLATYGEIMAAAAQRMAATRSVELEPAEQVDAALHALLDYLQGDLDVARFALIEIYGGGPAALAAIAVEDRRLGSTLRSCLDRRSRRVPKGMAAALIAASLHCARARLIDALPKEGEAAIDGLVDWARDMLDGREDFGILAPELGAARFDESVWGATSSLPGERDEEDLILAAVIRLASPDGFFSLTPSKVSSAAGVPAARFRRHFADLSDGYLAAVRRTCRSFFIELTAGADRDSAPRVSIRSALQRASRRAAADPAAARLTFRGIVEPGVAGLTCREALISELAAAYRSATPPALRPLPVRAEAHAAALWATLASPIPSAPRQH